MSKPVYYTSLAVYSQHDHIDEVSDALQQSPTRSDERSGTYSWIWSTQDKPDSETVGSHINLLKQTFEAQTEGLVKMFNKGYEIRAWIYFELDEVNRSFVLSEGLVSWLALFGADICVDIWGPMEDD